MYSFGICMWEMVMHQVPYAPPPPFSNFPRQFVRRCRAAVVWFVADACSCARRYGTASNQKIQEAVVRKGARPPLPQAPPQGLELMKACWQQVNPPPPLCWQRVRARS